MAQGPKSKEVVSKTASTRVIDWRRPAGASDPLWVELVVEGDDRWNGYTFRVTYESSEGELTGLEIRRAPGESARLGAHDLQRVNLGALDAAARRYVSESLTAWVMTRPAAARRLWPDPEDWLDKVADPGPGDVALARLCERYLELDGAPGWREALAAEFHYEASSVQTLISRARSRRYLTAVAPGQYGGRLTPKALRLLAAPAQRSAWDRATEEQRQAVRQRERQFDELDGALSAGEITPKEYAKRTQALANEQEG